MIHDGHLDRSRLAELALRWPRSDDALRAAARRLWQDLYDEPFMRSWAPSTTPLAMKILVRAIVTGFGLSVGSYVFRKISARYGLEPTPPAPAPHAAAGLAEW